MGRTIRIARVVPALDFGGVETRVGLQSEGHDRTSFELHVVAFRNDGRAAARIRAAGVPVHVLDVDPSVRNLNATRAVARVIRALRPDIVHASVAEGMFHGTLGGHLAGARRILLEEVGIPERGASGRCVFGGLYRTVDGVVAVSGVTRDYLVRVEHLPPERAWLVYNCPQAHFFREVDRNWTPGERGFRFLTSGRLVPQKNMLLLLEALGRLRSRGLDAEIHIAGEGPLRGELRRRAQELGLERSVRLLGFRSDVVQLLDACDAFVFPSLREGFSNALMEAMARGAPVISSDIPENVELASELGARWVISPHDPTAWADAMQAMVEMTPEQRRRHGMRGRDIVESRFSHERYLTDLEATYRAVLESSPPRLGRVIRRVASRLEGGSVRVARFGGPR